MKHLLISLMTFLLALPAPADTITAAMPDTAATVSAAASRPIAKKGMKKLGDISIDDTIMCEERIDEDIFDGDAAERGVYVDRPEWGLSIHKPLALLGIFFMPWLTALAALWIIMRYTARNRAERNRLIELSIRERQPLPREFYMRRRRSTRLQTGMVWIAWGVGLMLFFCVVDTWEMAALCSIPVLIGVSKIITYFAIDRRGNDDAL